MNVLRSILCAVVFLVAACAPSIGPIPESVSIQNESPVPFEPNLGQSSVVAKYLAHADHFTTYLSGIDADVTLRVRNEVGSTSRADYLRIHPVTSARSFPEPTAELTGRSRYSLSTPGRVDVEAPLFQGVRYQQVFPGIDITYSSDADRLSYELLLHPGAELSSVSFELSGQQSMTIDRDGNLIASVGDKKMVHSAVRGFQIIEGREVVVPVSYVVRAGRYLGLQSGQYDKAYALRLAPQVSTR